MSTDASIAYFSMEIALESHIPTYSGGLGVLAGDTVRAAADLKLPMVVVTLLHRKGYLFQRLDATGWQTEEPVVWVVSDFLQELSPRVQVSIDGHEVFLRAWEYDVQGCDGSPVPVILLDADLPENDAWQRTLTDTLYGGDFYYRLCQEIILGIGGVRMLRALGYKNLRRFHLNEGHASLLTIELLEEEKRRASRDNLTDEDIEAVRRQCIFTTHTPVEAGHDKFPMEMAARVIGLTPDYMTRQDFFGRGDVFNMTHTALNLAHYVNGVARKHGEISRLMFAGYDIDAITNGVHAGTWTSPALQHLFDTYIPGWRQDNFSLRYALSIPRDQVWEAHLQAKRHLVDFVNRETNEGFDLDHLTLGFARRAAPYKRGALLLSHPERLMEVVDRVGPIQIVYSGKAHPGDDTGKGIIQRIHHVRDELRGQVAIAYLPNHDMEVGKLMTAGSDVWVNTPQPPLEASGTSGMKAALNGVPSLSILDGWWLEGCIEGVTGWAIDGPAQEGEGRERWETDAADLYNKLETLIAPLFYWNRNGYVDMMRDCIALNGSFFNTHRMLQQYVTKAYFG